MSTSRSRSDFPIVDRCIYLNHAAISPWPAPVVAAMQAFVDDNHDNGPLNYAAWMRLEQRLRKRAAALIGAESSDDIALVKNTSEALNLVARGLDWQPGDAVVFPAGEFPSNALPWRALADKGVAVGEVELDVADPEATLIAALDRRVRLLAFSSVRYDTGLCLDIERLGRAARAHGALVCVDAIQHLGARPLDVAELPVDFVAAGSHKWLLAPEGLGLFWSAPAARARLRQTHYGWRMREDMFNFDSDHGVLPESGRRFEPGTLNNAGIRGLDAALGLLLETGMNAIAGAIEQRTGRFMEGLADLPDISLITPSAPDRHAGIVAFRPARADSRRLLELLRAADIHAAGRGGGVRLSPHFYTPESQIDRTLEVIRDAVTEAVQ